MKLVPQDAIAQNNDLGPLDFTSVDDLFKLALRSDAEHTQDNHAWLWVASDPWSGTTLGSNYRRFEFTPPDASASWEMAAPDEAPTDSGSPVDNSMDSMRLAIRNSTGVYTRDPVNYHYVDAFQVNDPPSIYSVGSGVLLEDPADIILHWLSSVGSEVMSPGDGAALTTALGSAVWGFDARSLGFSWDEVLQRMAFEARCNIVPIETSTGRVWRLLVADNDYGFDDTGISTITQTHEMSDIGRSVDDLASYFTFRYAFDASLPGNGNEEGFRLALIANRFVSDVPITTTILGNASERFGALDSGPVAFRCIQDPATAQDVAGYMVQERIANARRVFELREVAWFDALPHDVGDIVSITAPWASSATTCRITSMSKAFESNAWTITAVEVLTTGTRT
jgi:hypothetical protein